MKFKNGQWLNAVKLSGSLIFRFGSFAKEIILFLFYSDLLCLVNVMPTNKKWSTPWTPWRHLATHMMTKYHAMQHSAAVSWIRI
jgi:hypothetical protein